MDHIKAKLARNISQHLKESHILDNSAVVSGLMLKAHEMIDVLLVEIARAEGLERMWINQPSMSQPFHSSHGTNVLGYPESVTSSRIYYLRGAVISSSVPSNILSPGWVTPRDEPNTTGVLG